MHPRDRPAAPQRVTAAVAQAVLVTLAAVLAALLLASPPVAAQAEPVVDVAIDDPAPASISRDETASIVVTIRNPTSNPAPATIDVRLVNVPRGWHTTWDPPTLELAGGEAGTVTVLARADDAPAGTATFQITATATQGQPPFVTSADDRADITVTLDESTIGAIRDDLGDAGLAIIAAVVITLVALPVLISLRRRAGGIEIAAPEATITIAPGARASLPLHLRNRGSRDDTVHLALSAPGDAWDARLTVTDIDIPAKRSAAVDLGVQVPTDATGRHHVVVAASSERANRNATLDVIVEVAAPATG